MQKQNSLKRFFGGAYIWPAMFLLLALLIVPLIYTVYSGFFQYKYMMKGNFVGLQNYIYCLSDKKIRASFMTTIGVTVASTAISIVGGLMMALWIDRRDRKSVV